ncbi:hypothetical protein [Fuchsiella alkaliacetigena]|nr:hypothetical protein [Fuchsiella alkaliacetigena]MCK8826047.1 hypothetical protein [Fuchsiella alkaliacetigena]
MWKLFLLSSRLPADSLTFNRFSAAIISNAVGTGILLAVLIIIWKS